MPTKTTPKIAETSTPCCFFNNVGNALKKYMDTGNKYSVILPDAAENTKDKGISAKAIHAI